MDEFRRLLTSGMGDQRLWEFFSGDANMHTISWSLCHTCQELWHMHQHFALPKPHPSIGSFPLAPFQHLLPWPHPRICSHLEWLHLCNLNDLFCYYLSSQHSQRANESLQYHPVPKFLHSFPQIDQHYPDFTLFSSTP